MVDRARKTTHTCRAARKSQDGWEGSPGSSSDSDGVGGVLGDLPCPGAASEKEMLSGPATS